MYCANCGKENTDNARFCAGCGAHLGQKEHVVNGTKGRSLKKLIIGVVVCIVVLFGIKIGIEQYENKKAYMKQIENAENYYLQGDYTTALQYYNVAMEMNNKKEEAYIGISNIYRDWEDFETSKEYLNKGIDNGCNLEEYLADLEVYEEKYDFIIELKKYVMDGEYETAVKMLRSKEAAAYDEIYFLEGKIVDSPEDDGYYYIFDTLTGVYIGDVEDGLRNGEGFQFGLDGDSYYWLDGKWKDNAENGECVLHYNEWNEEYSMEFSGNFEEGYMDGEIEADWFTNDSLFSSYYYDYIDVEMGDFQMIREDDDGRIVYLEDSEMWWSASSEQALEKMGISPFTAMMLAVKADE